MAKTFYKVLILGGGAGGISVAAKLKQSLPSGSIAIVEPSEEHFYQPLWTLVGAGIFKKEESLRKESNFIPNGVTWIKNRVSSFAPDSKTVILNDGKEIAYDYLVIATGLKLNWNKIEGLNDNLGKNGICSIYQYDQLDNTRSTIQNFSGGTAIFVMPPTPIKCAGAPQKIMYLADDIFKKKGIGNKSKIIFATAGKAMFGIPTFAETLNKIVKARNIEPKFAHKIIGVDANKKEAIFEVTAENGSVTKERLKYDLLHLVPTMSAHEFISESGLAFDNGDQKGWLAVDKYTLQHIKYSNIFGIGDVTGVPNSKTGAAIRKQYPVVVKNLLAVMNGREPIEKYDGYSSCPMVVGFGKVMLAEFGYDGVLMPSFPLDSSIPRSSMWILKKYLLPKMYWLGMLKGRM
ncbi:MAG: NAD(P)/FAD-dependent oxidoreductase [Bdellovibrio sp.]